MSWGSKRLDDEIILYVLLNSTAMSISFICSVIVTYGFSGLGVWVKFLKHVKNSLKEKIPSPLFWFLHYDVVIFPTLKHKASFVQNTVESGALGFAWFCARFLTVKFDCNTLARFKSSHRTLAGHPTHSCIDTKWKFHHFKCTVVFL